MSAGPEHLVVGAGISGLYAALLLARAGERVRVIERSTRTGGLAGAELFRGIPCDLGSHRLHPAALGQPLFREIHATRPFLSRPRRGVLLFAGRRIAYPPNALSMMRALGLRASLEVAAGLLASTTRRRSFVGWEQERAPIGEDGDVGFERFVIDRVGARAYRAFYAPYAEKVWGLDPAELSQTVAKKRVSTTEPWALLRSAAGHAVARIEGRSPNDDGAASFFVYPPRGTSSIIEWLEEQLATLRVPIEKGRAFRHADARDTPVLFAGNLADLVPTSLEHRGLYLVYVALPLDRVAADETYYSPDRRYAFGRVSELQNYSPELRRAGETILCVEIPEGRWGTGVDFTSGTRRAALLEQLADAGLTGGARPIEVQQRFVPSVYPIYRRGWLREWHAAMQRVAALGNVLPFGRQALFLHCNLDHCADIASDAVEHVRAGRAVAQWIERATAYLELRVRD